MYLLLSILIIPFVYFISPDVKKHYEDFNKLQSLVATKHKGTCKIFFVSTQIVLKMFWLQFLQNVNNSVTNIDGRNAILTYIWNGRVYKMKITHKRGPSNVLSIHDENGNNVFDEISPFLGPKEDWHKIVYTPKFWGKKELLFVTSTQDEKVFFENDEIEL